MPAGADGSCSTSRALPRGVLATAIPSLGDVARSTPICR